MSSVLFGEYSCIDIIKILYDDLYKGLITKEGSIKDVVLDKYSISHFVLNSRKGKINKVTSLRSMKIDPMTLFSKDLKNYNDRLLEFKENIIFILFETLIKYNSILFKNGIEWLKFKIFLDNGLMRSIKHYEDWTDIIGLYGDVFIDNNDYNYEDVDEIKWIRLNRIISDKAILTEKYFHILTDIDDTLFAHSSAGIAGTDNSWCKNIPYPGIDIFYQMLYENNHIYCNDLPEVKYTTLLSASPPFRKLNAMKGNKPIVNRIIDNNFAFLPGKPIFSQTEPTGLGDVLSGTAQKWSTWHKTGTFFGIDSDSVANTKKKRFDDYSNIFPEYQMVFIGDNGQGDYLAGLYMLERSPNTFVFIHNIIENGEQKYSDQEMEDIYQEIDTYSNKNLFFFNNYLQLGYITYKLGFLRPNQFRKLTNYIKSITIKSNYKLSEEKDIDGDTYSNISSKISQEDLCDPSYKLNKKLYKDIYDCRSSFNIRNPLQHVDKKIITTKNCNSTKKNPVQLQNIEVEKPLYCLGKLK
jgi:hypothetical protein